jgi:hypothetical protein
VKGQALDAKLFWPSFRGYTLTRRSAFTVRRSPFAVRRSALLEGEHLIAEAETMENLAVGILSRLEDPLLRLTGCVRNGMPEGFDTYFLAPRLTRFTAQHRSWKSKSSPIHGIDQVKLPAGGSKAWKSYGNGQSITRRFPSPGCPQSLSRSFKNSSTPSNFFTSAKLIACVASLSTRPVFFHASHNSRMARAQTISDSMGQTTIL